MFRSASLLASMAFIAFALWPSQLPAQVRRELRVGAPGVPAVLDPADALDGTVPLIARQVFDTLVAYRDGSTDIDPALATRWAVSRDGLVWSFTLRDNVRFHDGAPLTAADVVASFERRREPEPARESASESAWSALLRGRPGVLKEVKAADPRTVQITLVQPYAPLLTVLAHPAFAVVRAGTAADGRERLIGTGPYRVVDASPGRVALEAVPGHWTGGPRAPRIVFLDVATDDNAEAELDARALDIWFAPTAPRRTEWALSTPGLRVGYMAFQTERQPLSRKKIRHAIAAALDPAAISVALERVAVPLQSFLPPGIWGRREPSPLLGGSRETVKRALAEGGWPNGFRPTLLVSSDATPPSMAKLAEALQSALGASDIPVNLRIEPGATVRSLLSAGDYDMALAEAVVAGGDPHLLLFPLSTSEGVTKGPQALNVSFYRNPKLDDVLIRASQLGFRPERQRLYQRAQMMLADEMPWIPVYVRLLWAVARPEVHGLRLHPTGVHRLDRVTLDPVAGG